MTNVEILDIVRLVENSPLTRFNDNVNYQSKLIDKLRNKFTSDEEHLFLASFYSYLNYGLNDFVIELRGVWKWLGFSRIDHAKTLLVKEFQVDKDYKTAPAVAGAVQNGGQNREDTFLTVRCFKKFCLKARTKKADKIHDYYLNLEESIQELLEEETNKLVTTLKIKEKELLIKDQELKLRNNDIKKKQSEITEVLTEREKGLVETFKKKRTIYIGKTEENVVKFGFTDDIETRIYRHKSEISKDFTFTYVYESMLNREIEREIKKNHKNNRISKDYKGKTQTELLQLNDKFTIEDLHQSILKIKAKLEEADDKKKQTKIEELEETVKTLIEKRQFIARHLITGEEKIFTSYEAARKISGIGPHSIKDNYLNKPRQSRGWTFRTVGKPYWQPPNNYNFNTAFKPSSHMKVCKSTHLKTRDVQIYNSVIEAAYFIGLHKEEDTKKKKETDRRTLNRTVNGGKTIHPIIGQYKWEPVEEVCGSWIQA